MDELEDMDLTDTVQADGPQILLESWLATLRSESLTAILQFVRSLEEIRGDKKSNDLFQAIILALREIKSSGADLTAGDVKTIPEARQALIQLMAARNVQIRRWTAHINQAVDTEIAVKKVAASAMGTFGQVAGAPTGAAHSMEDLRDVPLRRNLCDAYKAASTAGENERLAGRCLRETAR